MQVVRIGLDLAKFVFVVHGVDAHGKTIVRKTLRRAVVSAFFANLPPCPAAYGPHKTFCNRFIRWSRMGVFNCIFAALAGAAGTPETAMIDATHLKAHRTARRASAIRSSARRRCRSPRVCHRRATPCDRGK